MDSSCTKRRGRRSGKKRYPAFGKLPSGRAPVGTASALSRTSVPVIPKFNTSTAQAESDNKVVLNQQVLSQTLLVPITQSVSTCIEMLGAQARAAELQAMRAAAQRQKSHESEDPPKPAPVSLTDFVRPLQNRNKGLKTYKPLNLADLDEDKESSAACGEDYEEASTPAPKDGPGPAVMQVISAELPGDITGPIASPMRLAPTAPKAMLAKALAPHPTLPSSVSATPKRQPQPFQPQNSSGMLRREYPAHTFMINPLASPYLQVPDTDSSMLFPNPLTNQFSNDEFLFGLSEYSPCKPETKYEYSHALAAEAEDEGWSKSARHRLSTPHGGSMAFNQQTYHDPYQLAFPQALTPYGEPFMYHQSPMLQCLSDAGVAGHGNAGYFPDYNQMNRAHTFVNDLMNHENEIYQSSALPSVGLQRADRPYDRSTKMQSFVAAQQAMAKTGKTVLHNPSLQKAMSPGRREVPSSVNMSGTCVQESPVSICTTRDSLVNFKERSPSAWPSLHNVKPPHFAIPVSESDPSPEKEAGNTIGRVVTKKLVRRKVEDFPAIVRALSRRDEPVAVTTTLSCDPKNSYKAFNWPANGGSYTRLSFPTDDDVGTNSWCELRAPSYADREKTRKVFRIIAADMNTRDDRDMVGNHTVVLGDAARKWLHDATDRQDERRKTIETIVDDHMTGSALKGTGFGIIGGPVKHSENIKVNIGSIKAFANIMATVDQYAEDDKRQEGRKTFVPLPYYAIDSKIVHDADTASMIGDNESMETFAHLIEVVDSPRPRGQEASRNAKSRVSLKL